MDLEISVKSVLKKGMNGLDLIALAIYAAEDGKMLKLDAEDVLIS